MGPREFRVTAACRRVTRVYICPPHKQLGIMAGLTLSLLGAPSLRLSPGTSSRGLGTSKGLALLAYLALEAGPHTREELAALLWGDSPETAARASLRQTLKRLRTLVADALHVDRETVELRGAVQCDVEAFLQAAEHEPERAADYPVDRFFSGVSLRHAPAFEDWRMRKRQALMQRWREAVRCLTRDALARSHWGEAGASAARRPPATTSTGSGCGAKSARTRASTFRPLCGAWRRRWPLDRTRRRPSRSRRHSKRPSSGAKASGGRCRTRGPPWVGAWAGWC